MGLGEGGGREVGSSPIATAIHIQGRRIMLSGHAEVKCRWVLALLVMEAIMPGSAPAAAQTAPDPLPSLKVGTASATRGQKVTGVIAVPAGQDAATNIAVAVVHGAKPGPVLAVVAG